MDRILPIFYKKKQNTSQHAFFNKYTVNLLENISK